MQDLFIIFLCGTIIGFMMFFVAVISPTVFKTLSGEMAAAFLRSIFPKMFIFGLIISLGLVVLSALAGHHSIMIIFSAVSVGFFINCFVITPKINTARDAVLEGHAEKEKSFKLLHLLSVLIFVAQFIAILVVMGLMAF